MQRKCTDEKDGIRYFCARITGFEEIKDPQVGAKIIAEYLMESCVPGTPPSQPDV
jgi:hypothetical protein